MKLAFMGTPEFAVPTLRALLADPAHEVCLVVTQPDKSRGRSKRLQPPRIKEVALEHDLPVWQPARLKDADDLRAAIEEAGLDAVIVIAYGKFIPTAWLPIPRLGFINVHASLLPAYRGAAPINRAILDGRHTSGVSIMQIDSGMDSGAVYCQAELPIGDEETAVELTARLAKLGAETLVNALPLIDTKDLTPVAQDESLVSPAPMLAKEEGRIDWNTELAEIHNRVRALVPWPAAFTTLNGKTVKILRATTEHAAHNLAPGTLTKDGARLKVACKDGFLIPQELQMEGKKPMDARAFACGLRGDNIIFNS